ncbi:hypothetical protein MNBD_GAMMA06-1609 [hydrothermal vent metagenome]|uniref:DUF302 domain-containing protein n=1 Tax=hydrothermal vent metagenome TaxID=652676 RepID=A0A3B0W6J0_9ZZZZ
MQDQKQGKKIKNLFVSWCALLVLMLPALSYSDEAESKEILGVYMQHVNKPVSAVYDTVYKSLENAGFFVVFEPNIGKNLARFSDKWGDDYNRNNISVIRSMVFCNGWYANKVSNLDPNMLGFCPLHLTLIEREGKTTVLFNRPAVVAENSPAKALFVKIEAEVIEAIQKGLSK